MDTCEINLNADIICNGSKRKVESITLQTVRVKPFSDDLREIEKVALGSVLGEIVKTLSEQ